MSAKTHTIFPQSTPQAIPPCEPNGPAVLQPPKGGTTASSPDTARVGQAEDVVERRPAASSVPQSAKQLFVQFLETYLDIKGLFVGFQSRFGRGSDLILFRSPKTGSTLAVDCTVMLNSRRENALEIVQQKIKANETEFAEAKQG